MKKIKAKYLALLLCGGLLFSDLASIYAYADNDIFYDNQINDDAESSDTTTDEGDIIDADSQVGDGDINNDNEQVGDSDISGSDTQTENEEDGQDDESTAPGVDRDDTDDNEDSGTDEASDEPDAPIIDVQIAEGGHGSNNFYCEPPIVTVTDDESDIVLVEVSSGGNTETISMEPECQNYTVDLSGKSGAVTITATNEAEHSTTVKFYISHSLGSRNTIIVEATCTEPKESVLLYVCVNCDEVYFRIVEKILEEASGHQFGEAEPGQTQDGQTYVKRTCSKCGYVDVIFGNGVIHNHAFSEESITVEATCLKEGSIYKLCTECGYKEILKIIPCKGHKLGAFKTIQEMDCGENKSAILERTCAYCDYEETITYPATHSWSELKPKKKATCTEAGEKARQCLKCKTWSENITSVPKLPHQWEDDDNDCTTPLVCSNLGCQTRDETSIKSHVLLYAYDESGHWQECQNESCNYKTEPVGEHIYIEDKIEDCTDSETCTICGYVKSGNKSHNIEWIIDAASHYAVCRNAGCVYQSEPENHAGTDDGDCTTPVLCTKCEYPYKAAKSHTPYGAWEWNNEGHYRSCRDCNQVVMIPHEMGEDDGDCTTNIKCKQSGCFYIMKRGEAAHNLSGSWEINEDGHYKLCMNPNCNKKSDVTKHSGGFATCNTKAQCSTCGASYGSFNPNNHSGGTEIRGYAAPTKSKKGYTGDTYCLGCDQIISSGTEIDTEPCENHVFGEELIHDSMYHWKECKECYFREDYSEHVFGDWEVTDREHMRDCDICGYIETALHIPEADDYDCSTALKCNACEKVLTEAREHSFEGATYWGSETGHYQFCQNEGCTRTSEEEPHSGGTASCASQAVCEVCNTSYGTLNPENHVGREQILGYRAPVGTTPGYTGDVYCLSCAQVKAYGQEIPPEEREHDFIIDYDAYYHWRICSRCGQRENGSYEEHKYDDDGNCTLEGCHAIRTSTSDEHNWDQGEITIEPTCIQIGVKTYTCTHCGAHKIEEIPATGIHTWEKGKCTVCGMEASEGFWVSDVSSQLYTGKAIKPAVNVYYGATLLTEKVDYTLSYKNNTKVNDASNQSTAPVIVITGKGSYSGKKYVYFSIAAKNLLDSDIIAPDIYAVENNREQKPVPAVTYQNNKLTKNKDFEVSYPDLEDSGKTDAYKAAGTYKIKIKGIGNYTGERTIDFCITSGALISKAKVASIPAQEYTGSQIKPGLKVTHGKKMLSPETDYTVEYLNNIQVGKATVIITGIGDYAGRKEVSFNINGKSIAKATVTGLENKVYNGQEQKQGSENIKVKLGEEELVENEDYQVTYDNHINVGNATMTIKGINAYSGSIKKKFKITAYDLSVDDSQLIEGFPENMEAAYTKGGSTPDVELYFGSEHKRLAAKKDYTITYSNNKKIAGAGDLKKPTIAIKGKGNFKGTKTIPFTIVKSNLEAGDGSVKLFVADMPYVNKAGKYISKPVLTDSNDKKLTAGTDYEMDIVYNLSDGTVLDKKSIVPLGETVYVTVTGKGCYEGTVKASYKIAKSSFASAKITIKPQMYTGSEITFDKFSKDDIIRDNIITAKIGSSNINYGDDFEIVEGSYKNNLKKGTASVMIKGKGEYAGTRTVMFKIIARSM
ncbi:MAG: hypothetical protein J1E98_07010 [Lachnospiraceae bacterium]|nr:hypothetical protein [Lachnospiraceae bacterium]